MSLDGYNEVKRVRVSIDKMYITNAVGSAQVH